MRKRLGHAIVVASLAVGMVALAPSGASADPREGDCPSGGGWFLLHSHRSTDAHVDRNGDTWLCYKQVEGEGNSELPGHNVKDNNN